MWTQTNTTGNQLSSIGNGAYPVVITDANGCQLTTSVFISPSSDALRVVNYSHALSGGLGVLVGMYYYFLAVASVLHFNNHILQERDS